jgi:hypothetical protein
MSCGARAYTLTSAQLAAMLAQIQTSSATVTGTNPWLVDTHQSGVTLSASYDTNTQLLTLTVTDSAFYVPCSTVWSQLESYITTASAVPSATALPAVPSPPVPLPSTQPTPSSVSFPGPVVDDTGAVVAGASFNQYGYPVDQYGSPLTSDPPSPGATLGPAGQAWVDPATGENLDASGNPISESTPEATNAPILTASATPNTAPTSSSTAPWIIGGLIVAGAVGLLYFGSRSGNTRTSR